MGQLLGIAVRSATRAPMETKQCVQITEQSGVEGDYRGKYGPRQITVLSQEAWNEACKDVQTELPWTTRRANLLISGLELEQTTRKILQIGDVRLAITGETEPCERMDMQHQGLRKTLTPAWRGGVTCFVMTEGEIQVGDEVELLSSTDSSD
jgi:MOSC domain-containing protein YiiM